MVVVDRAPRCLLLKYSMCLWTAEQSSGLNKKHYALMKNDTKKGKESCHYVCNSFSRVTRACVILKYHIFHVVVLIKYNSG